MAFVRHLKVTLCRGTNVNAYTSLLFGKSRTVVTAKASYKNLVYATSPVEDMGQNPAWEEDGTNVFHFDFEDESGFVRLELFNKNDDSIGVAKLLFSELGHLMPGRSETKILPVMVATAKQFGEVILAVEILEQQAMGDRGLLTVVIRKGFIQKIKSIFPRETQIQAKLIYKHTTFSSGVLKNMGKKFIWYEDNTFRFIINSNVKADDTLQLEIYNFHTKVAKCEMLMSLLLERVELVTHDLSLRARHGPVGNIEVAASFTPKPVYVRRSQEHPSSFAPPPGINPIRTANPLYLTGEETSYSPSAPVYDQEAMHHRPQEVHGAPAGSSEMDDEMRRFIRSFH